MLLVWELQSPNFHTEILQRVNLGYQAVYLEILGINLFWTVFQWLEIWPLTNNSSKTVINALRENFTGFYLQHSVQLLRMQFLFFISHCKFIYQHTSSPKHGMFEKAVEICNHILRKGAEKITISKIAALEIKNCNIYYNIRDYNAKTSRK